MPERRVDPSAWIDTLESEGFRSFEYVRQILGEIGGLIVCPPERTDGAFFPLPFQFDPVAAASGELDRVRLWEPLSRERLFPLGVAFDHMLMLVGEGGRIHLGHMSELYLLGECVEAALNNLIEAKHKPAREGAVRTGRIGDT